MSDKKITIVAKVLAKEEKADQIKIEFLKLVSYSRSDEGCITYDLHQDNENPNLFVVYENWENRDSLERHAASKHFVNFMEVTKEAIAEFTVREMTQIA